jgi:predicted nucleic acid-binding protein
MILADTSVWIDHLRSPGGRLSAALDDGDIAIHPFIIGELACGNLRNRRELLSLWSNLPLAPTATDAEALAFIDRHKLMGLGLGFIDVHLLAATALGESMRLWTHDRRLAALAATLELALET